MKEWSLSRCMCVCSVHMCNCIYLSNYQKIYLVPTNINTLVWQKKIHKWFFTLKTERNAAKYNTTTHRFSVLIPNIDILGISTEKRCVVVLYLAAFLSVFSVKNHLWIFFVKLYTVHKNKSIFFVQASLPKGAHQSCTPLESPSGLGCMLL